MSWKRVCSVSDVPAESIKRFDVRGTPIVIVNYGAGFRALPPICPHMEEPLEDSGIVADCVLTCTKHLWAWNLQTLDMLGETERPLKTYEVKEENGEILVMIDRQLVYDFGGDEAAAAD